MRNRNLIDGKLQTLEGVMTTLLRIVNTSEPIEAYRVNIQKGQALIEEARDLISLEPVGPGEHNNH